MQVKACLVLNHRH